MMIFQALNLTQVITLKTLKLLSRILLTCRWTKSNQELIQLQFDFFVQESTLFFSLAVS